MKKAILGFFCAVSIFGMLAFSGVIELTDTSAKARVVDGIIIYSDSEPLKEYQVIGNVRTAIQSYQDETYIDGRNALIEKCKKDYPTGQALLMKFNVKGHKYTADVITFKN